MGKAYHSGGAVRVQFLENIAADIWGEGSSAALAFTAEIRDGEGLSLHTPPGISAIMKAKVGVSEDWTPPFFLPFAEQFMAADRVHLSPSMATSLGVEAMHLCREKLGTDAKEQAIRDCVDATSSPANFIRPEPNLEK